MNRLLPQILDEWKPRPVPRLRDWIPDNLRIPSTTETAGRFRGDLFPHILDAYDLVQHPEVRLCYFPGATRCGKTFFCLSHTLSMAFLTGRPAVHASADEGLTDNDIEEKLLPMARESPTIAAGKVRKERLGIRLGNGALIRKAFPAPSGRRLAGFPACYGDASEAGLWKKNDIGRLTQRGRNFGFSSKYIVEGKREDRGNCTISDLVRQKHVRRYYRYVKCPQCGEYQRLQWGYGQPGAGVKWGKLNGKTDYATALRTAHYECVSGCQIYDDQRPEMIQKGAWVAEGQTINPDGSISGTPTCPTSRVIALDGMSGLYSLVIEGWTHLVAEWFETDRREFITGTLGEEYDPAPKVVASHELADMLGTDIPAGVCPDWARFVVVTADVGGSGDDLWFWWIASAWGANDRGEPIGHVVDRGLAESRAAFVEFVDRTNYRVGDGSIKASIIGPDSGSFTQSIYELCGTHKLMIPLAGSRTSNWPDWYKPGIAAAGLPAALVAAKKKSQTFDLLTINTERTQQWRLDVCQGRVVPGGLNSITVASELSEDHEFLDQILADFKDDKGHWNPRVGFANEWGDAFRYARPVAEFFVNSRRRIWKSFPKQKRSSEKPKPKQLEPSSGRFRLLSPGGGVPSFNPGR